jgi:hypothetical protein
MKNSLRWTVSALLAVCLLAAPAAMAMPRGEVPVAAPVSGWVAEVSGWISALLGTPATAGPRSGTGGVVKAGDGTGSGSGNGDVGQGQDPNG